MSIDAYAPCPCGSGKKLKFCCQAVVGEMEKVFRLLENEQYEMALRALETISAQHPRATWPLLVRAEVLTRVDRVDEARELLESVVSNEPEHPSARILLARICLVADGFEAAKPEIHLAFRLGAKNAPDAAAQLALQVAGAMADDRAILSARKHLELAMFLARDRELQGDVFMQLWQFDGDHSIPFPLRGHHALDEVPLSDETDRTAQQKALRLSSFGCWEEAAEIFADLVSGHPDEALLWRNLGLCRAWDANDIEAAEALHESARRDSDWERAVETETLAQLLDMANTDDLVRLPMRIFHVQGSAGALLSRLDAHERFVRERIPDEDEAAGERVASEALYDIADRPVVPAEKSAALTPETAPRMLAKLKVFAGEATADEQPLLSLVCLDPDSLDSIVQLLRDVAGPDVQLELVQEDAEQPDLPMPREVHAMEFDFALHPDTPAKVGIELHRRQWQRLIENEWPQRPLAALGGKSPQQAAGDPALRVALAAAINVLDTFRGSQQFVFDAAAMRQRLGLEAPQPYPVTENTPLHVLSVLQMHRLPLEQVSDEQLLQVFNRAVLIAHPVFLERVLNEAAGRPAVRDQLNPRSLYQSLAEICDKRGDDEAAYRWIAEGRRATAEKAERPFEEEVQWDLFELRLRIRDLDDPELKNLLKRLWGYYGAKIPTLREHLMRAFEAVRLPASLVAEVTSTPDTEVPSTGGIWTPETEQAPAQSGKLWIPGQS